MSIEPVPPDSIVDGAISTAARCSATARLWRKVFKSKDFAVLSGNAARQKITLPVIPKPN